MEMDKIIFIILIVIISVVLYFLYIHYLKKKYYEYKYNIDKPVFHVHTIQQQNVKNSEEDIQLSNKDLGLIELNTNQNGIRAYEYFLESIKKDYDPESVIHIAKLYSNGLHNSINPDKITALRIYNVILRNHVKFPNHILITAQEQFNDLTKYNNDIDYQQGNHHLSSNFPFELEILLTKFQDIQKFNENRQRMEEDRIVHPLVNRLHNYTNNILFYDNPDDDNDDYIQDVILQLQQREYNNPVEVARFQVANDTQNVHSTSVLNCSENVLHLLIQKNRNQLLDYHTCYNNIIEEAIKHPKIKLTNIRKVLETLSDASHSRFDNKSDKEIFQIVVTSIENQTSTEKKDNLYEILLQQIESAIEKSHVVCNTGRIVRFLSIYDGIDDSIQKIVPEWVIDQELGNLATKIRDSILLNSTTNEKQLYDTGESDELTIKMTDEFKKQATLLYKDKIPKERLESKINLYSQGF